MLTIREAKKAEAKAQKPGSLWRLMNTLFMCVHADEGGEPVTQPTPSTTSGSPAPAIDLEKILAQVRREEKDKLYGEINKLKEQNKSLRESNNGYLVQIAALNERIEKAESKAAENNTDALNGKIKELESQLEEAKKAAPNEEELRKKIEAEFEVKLYAEKQLTENKDKILSTFAPDVSGKTKEEVDAAIKAAVEKSTAIKKELGLIDENGNPVEVKGKKASKAETAEDNPAGTNKPSSVRPRTSAAPSASEPKTFDAEYVRNLDPRSEEYKEFRKKMGLH